MNRVFPTMMLAFLESLNFFVGEFYGETELELGSEGSFLVSE